MRPIDADAVLKKVLSIPPYCGHCDGYGFVELDMVEDAIKDATTIEAAPVKHGRWIDRTKSVKGLWDYRFDCSTCGHIFWNAGIKNFNYCPNCGCKMDLEET